MAVPRFGQFMPQQPSILEGIKTASNIAQAQANLDIRRKQEEREAGLAPSRRQLLEAQAKKIREQAEHPEMELAGLPQIARQRAHVAALKKVYGDESPQVINAKKDLDLEINNQKSQLAYREALAKALPVRMLTPVSKAAKERWNIEHGLSPTGETVEGQKVKLDEPVSKDAPIGMTTPIVEGVVSGSPEAEAKLANMTPKDLIKAQDAPFGSELSASLSLYASKQAGLGDNIKKLPYAQLVEVSIGRMDPQIPAALSYAGVEGAKRLVQDKIEAQRTGKITPELEAYRRFKEAAAVFGMQVTQFYGASVNDKQQKLIREATDPISWDKSPGEAAIALDELKELLRNEINMRKDLVTKPSYLLKTSEKTNPLYKKIKATGYTLNQIYSKARKEKMDPMILINKMIELSEKK